MRKLLLPAVLALAATSAYAIPAKPGVLQYKNADGTTVAVTLHGDEFGHYYMTEDGYALMPGTDHNLYYMTVQNGTPVISQMRAGDVDKRTAAEKQFVGTLDRTRINNAVLAKVEAHQLDNRAKLAAPALKQAPAKAADATDNVMNGRITNYPTLGSPNAMVLLVEFSDVKFSGSDPHQAFEDLMNKPGYNYNGATGSAKDYYSQCSNGLFTPNFEVYGPITLPKGESYYGSSTPTAYDANAAEMVTTAVEMLHEQRPDLDWSKFDNDGDGFVDSIFLFYAGYGQNEGAPDWTIWPHSANLYQHFGVDMVLDGVRINNYACTNELQWGTDDFTGIGTFCHEYGHVCGLPDLYSTTSSSMPNTPGYFEVMDRGSYANNGNTPPQFSCYDKFSLGWINPRVLSGSEDITLKPLEEGECLLVKTELPYEYFMLENRQRSGWDAYLPGHGMLIWHIDFDQSVWTNNRVNVELTRPRVDLIEADGVYGEESRSGDPFPGTSVKRRFTKDTSPAFKTWNGVDPGFPLTDIYEVDGLITFKVKDGGANLAAPVAKEALNVTPTSFEANWEAVAGATQYVVDLCKAPAIQPFRSVKVSGASSILVDGLNPSTTYTYNVKAMDDERTSVVSNTVTVTTLDPSFDMLAVELLPATEIKGDGFRLDWNELKNAEGYELDVYTKYAPEAQHSSCDFTKAADGTFLPTGWSSTSTTLNSMVGHYGEAAPSLRLNANNDRLVLPTLKEYYMSELKFWYRGNTTDDKCALTVEALIDGTWVPFYTITPVSRTATTVVFSEAEDADARIPDFARSLRIAFTKASAGSVSIDDVIYGYTPGYQNIPVDGYKSKDLGKTTSTTVSGLAPLTTYYCTLRGYNDDKLYSLPSAEQQVMTADPASVAGVAAGGLRISRHGAAIVLSTDEPARFSIYSVAGQLMASGSLKGGEQKSVVLPAGVYVIHTQEGIVKIVM